MLKFFIGVNTPYQLPVSECQSHEINYLHIIVNNNVVLLSVSKKNGESMTKRMSTDSEYAKWILNNQNIVSVHYEQKSWYTERYYNRLKSDVNQLVSILNDLH